MDVNKLLNSKHIKTCGNKYLGWSCIIENGISELFSITMFCKVFYLPKKFRKLTRHKERF